MLMQRLGLTKMKKRNTITIIKNCKLPKPETKSRFNNPRSLITLNNTNFDANPKNKTSKKGKVHVDVRPLSQEDLTDEERKKQKGNVVATAVKQQLVSQLKSECKDPDMIPMEYTI